MKKIKQQLKHLANRSGPIASATGAVTSKDISFLQGTQDRNGRSTDEVYSVRFVQHEMGVPEMLVVWIRLRKTCSKYTFFLLEQKEVMIVYNWHTNCRIKADPVECILATTERTWNHSNNGRSRAGGAPTTRIGNENWKGGLQS